LRFSCFSVKHVSETATGRTTMTQMTAKVVRTERGIEIRVPPLLRGISSREYFSHIEEHLKDAPHDLYFDCSEATLIDSTAIGKIIFMAKELRRHNRRVVFESCPPSIRDFLTRVKATDFINLS